MDSPVTIDSSTELRPSSTMPSTGIFSPGRTRSLSPTFTCSSGTSYSLPSSRMMRASLGERSSSARMALLVRLRARSSRTCPSSTRTMIAAAASKYTSGWPSMHAHGGWEDLRSDGGDRAVDVGHADAHGDQREHVRAAEFHRRPAALEERPAAPQHDGSCQRELKPRADTRWEQVRQRPHAQHRVGHQRNAEQHAGPEAPCHVA